MKCVIFFILFCLPVFLFSQSQLEILVSPDLSYRTLTDEVVGGVRQQESPKFNFHFQVNYLQKLKEKLWLKLGVGFSNLGYRSEFYGNLRYGSQHNGGGIFDPLASIIDVYEVKYNYQFLEIPIALRKDFFGKKITPFVELGISTMYYLQSYDKIFEGENSAQFHRDEKVTSIQFAPTLAFGVTYKMNEKIEWFCQPNFRFHLTKMVKDAPVKEHQWSVGVGLGMRMKLK